MLWFLQIQRKPWIGYDILHTRGESQSQNMKERKQRVLSSSRVFWNGSFIVGEDGLALIGTVCELRVVALEYTGREQVDGE